MKHLRKATLFILALMMTLALGIFAAACGDETGSGSVVLTFNAGSGEPYTLEAEAGSTVTPPVPDARDGYFFDGWFVSSDFSGAALGSSLTAPETDTTYYGKWTRGYLLTLALNGGTMSGEKTLLLREGANLSEAVAAYLPAKDGLTFGAWMLDGKELTANDRMPAGELTLTAGWKVGYTVQVYLQNKTADGYELSSGSGTEGSGYVGANTAPAVPSVTGFYLTTNENELTEAVLTETASSNVFRFYFAREEYLLAFDANLPEGIEAEGEVSDLTALFEQEVTIPDDGFSAAGRLFAGWSTQRTGGVEYQPGESLPLMHNLVLYAVWDVGCTDLWGSEDLIYAPSGEPGKAILERFGEVFEGTIDQNGVFEIAGMRGMIYHGSVFAYYRGDYAATFSLLDGYYHAEETNLIDENTTLTLDGYLNATLRSADGVIVGSYGYDLEAGSNYIAAEDGTILYFRLGNYQNTAVFGIRGDEAGVYEQFVPTDETSGTFGRWTVLLDGYGSALLGDTSSGTYSEGVYYFEDSGYSAGGEEIRFYHVFTAETGELIFHNYPLTSGDALVLADGLAGDYKGTIDGKETTVTLDGFGLLNGATIDGDPNSACTYYTTESGVFGTILYLLTDDGTVTLLLTEPGKFEEIDVNYTELLYLRTDGSGPNLFYPAILLYEDENALRAELYAPDDDGVVHHVATADCTVRNDLPEYRFLTLTLRQTDGGADVIFPGFGAAFESAAILLNTESLVYDIYSVLEYNGEKFYTEYKYKTDDEDDEDDRVFWETLIDSGVNGIGSFWFGDGKVIEGRAVDTYTNIEEFGFRAVAFTYYNEDDRLETRYFALYDDGTFLDLDEEPDHAMFIDEYGTQKQQAGVYFDGLGNAYFFATGNDFYDHNCIGGPVRKTEEKTSFGAEIWIIEPEEGEPLRFVLEQETENTLVAYVLYEEPVSLTGENGTFAADGYNFMASFESADGIGFTGLYHMLNAEDCSIPDEFECAYVMMAQDGLFWRIYVREDGTFEALYSPLGNMDGSTLMVMDDSYNALGFLMVSLEDGEMSVTYIGMDETVGIPMSEGNPFVPTDDGAVSLTLMLMNETTESMDIVTWVLGDFSVDSCVIFNEAICGLYRDGAASYEMDGYGYGVYTDRYGFRNEGAYVFIDETHVAFEFAQSAGNAVLKIDAEEKTFTEMNLAPYYATYYCGDSTIEFADYVYIDGTPVGFWYAEDGVVVFAIYSDDDGTYHTVTFNAGESFVYEGNTYTPTPTATDPGAEALLPEKFEG